MEMLAAMMSGAVGGAVIRNMMRQRRGLWLATVLGIIGGWGAWWLLGEIGPAPKAGPIVIWHMVAGMIAGGAVAALALMLVRRAG